MIQLGYHSVPFGSTRNKLGWSALINSPQWYSSGLTATPAPISNLLSAIFQVDTTVHHWTKAAQCRLKIHQNWKISQLRSEIKKLLSIRFFSNFQNSSTYVLATPSNWKIPSQCLKSFWRGGGEGIVDAPSWIPKCHISIISYENSEFRKSKVDPILILHPRRTFLPRFWTHQTPLRPPNTTPETKM